MISVLTNLLTGILGGIIGAYGSIRAARALQRDLEADELRKLRLQCIVSISGLRHVISDGAAGTTDTRSQLMFDLNRAPLLWAQDTQVLNILREIRDGVPGSQGGQIVRLLRGMAQSTSIPAHNLTDADLGRLFVIGAQ